MTRTAIAAGAGLLFHGAALAADCDMRHLFDHPDKGGTTTTAVWRDKERDALLFADAIYVNTDGAKRSYRVTDFWGEHTALNNLCNAMTDACARLDSEQKRHRRLLTERARELGWPQDLLATTKLSPAVIPFKNGQPCPEVDGYLVSATSLHKPKMADVCDPSNYVDSTAVPAIVLPMRSKDQAQSHFERHGADIGDLAAVMSEDLTKVVFAVVGDRGPAKELGEGTIALAAALLGKGSEPENFMEIRGKGKYEGKGWNIDKAYVLVFPGTRSSDDPYMTKDRIDADTRARFAAWGGPERLQACSKTYKR